MKTVLEFLSEETIVPPEIPNTMTFWHGGNLDDYDETISHKKGRFEYGAGLYLITNYQTAAKYAKGGRKLYMVTVERGNDAETSSVSWDDSEKFISSFCIKSKVREVISRISKYVKDGRVKAYYLINIILGEEAIKPTNTARLREFLIGQGIDYQTVTNPFGWGETMMVLYNMKKIVQIKQVTPKDKIEVWDFPTDFRT